MPLTPQDERHRLQIEAGTKGRQKGHTFERELTAALNELDCEHLSLDSNTTGHLIAGHPAATILRYIIKHEGIEKPLKVKAWWVGALATSGQGDVLTDEEGNIVTKCKSDVVIRVNHLGGVLTTGVSVKTCSKRTPTNDQLFFTTASAFCRLLRSNNIHVSDSAEKALKMFCGDAGFRPKDDPTSLQNRESDPDRWYFEELPGEGKEALTKLLTDYQRDITTILLQKAYLDDPYAPDYILHQTIAYADISKCPMAIFAVDELVNLSCKAGGFSTRPYYVRKGRFKGDKAEHLAPRFGFVQMQRGGQKQHPTQLQFNLQAGYFNKLVIDESTKSRAG